MKRILLLCTALTLTLIGVFSAGGVIVNSQSPTGTAVAQAATPTPDATGDPELDPLDPTPTPVVPVTKTPDAPNAPRLKPPKTLDDLKRDYPDLGPFIDKYKDAQIGEVDLTALYAQIVAIYEKDGATGVAVFLEESGLLEKINLPLSYLDLLRAYDQGGLEAVSKLARQRQIINSDDEIVGYLALDSKDNLKAASDALTALAVSVYTYNDQKEELEIGVPLAVLAQYQTPGKLLEYLIRVANAPHVVGFRAPFPVQTDGLRLGEVKGVGAKTMGADKWHAAGFTGKGVRIGILDSGFQGIKDYLGTDLPENVTANFDLDSADDHETNHGLAVAMVIHSIAPDAELVLAYDDGASFENYTEAIKFLAENKVQIINQSRTYPFGPRDGSWGDALLVDEFVRETGVLWVNSAGNMAQSHSMFKFNEGKDGLHLFGQNKQGEDVYVMPFITFVPVTQVVMNWNGKWTGGERTQYNFVVLDKDGNEVAAANEPRRGRKNDFPLQSTVFESEPKEMYFLVVQRSRGNTDNVLDIFIKNTELAPWAQVAEYSVTMPGDADSALTVGATGLTSDELEVYSSQGPTIDGRIKPDVTGPTGEALPMYEEGFFGTSGSTPMIAGAAALVWQAAPEFTNAEVKAYLIENVLDLGDDGPDARFGAGRLQLPEPPGGKSEGGQGGEGEGGEIVIGGEGEEGGGSTEPSAAITDVGTKFNVKNGKETGLQVRVTFELDNYSGKQLVVAVLFFDEEGNKVPSANKKYDIDGTIGTGIAVEPSTDQTVYDDVTLFIANSAFKSVKVKTLYFVVGVLDATDEQNPTLLTKSEPVKVKIRGK